MRIPETRFVYPDMWQQNNAQQKINHQAPISSQKLPVIVLIADREGQFKNAV